MEKKVWFVKGLNGLGSALVSHLLAEGHYVALTDGSDEQSAMDALRDAYATYGRIDIFVNNNAGAADASPSDAALLQTILPRMKKQGSGRILQIASFTGIPNTMVSQQVINLSAALAVVIRPLGITVTAVVPGAFSTNLISESTFVPVQATRYLSIDGRQMGDPTKAAEALLQCALMPEPPALLILGSNAYRLAAAKMEEFGEQLNRLSHSAHGKTHSIANKLQKTATALDPSQFNLG